MDILRFFPENPDFLLELLLRLALDFVPALLIVRYIYYRLHHRKEYLFTLLIFNILIFFICAFLQNAELGVGFAFGLFAVFGIMRYRTETVSIREMTYLFIVIALAMLNALANPDIGVLELILINSIIIAATYLLERMFIDTSIIKVVVTADLDLIRPERHNELLEELKTRTGLNIKQIRIDYIDYKNNQARLRVTYAFGKGETHDTFMPVPEEDSD